MFCVDYSVLLKTMRALVCVGKGGGEGLSPRERGEDTQLSNVLTQFCCHDSFNGRLYKGCNAQDSNISGVEVHKY